MSGIDRHHHVGAGDHFDFLFRGLDLQNDGRQTHRSALRHRDALFFKGLQTRRGNRNGVCSRQNGREIKDPGVVRDGVAKGIGGLVFQDDFRCRDYRARRVGDRGADRSARKLREYGQLRDRQGRNQ